MAIPPIPLRMLTGYDYWNLSLSGCKAYGHVWTDSGLRQIKWMNGDGTQGPWHGVFEVTRNGLFLAFDAFFCFRRERPTLKWTKLDQADSGDFVGTDYKGRVVRMIPVCRLLYNENTGGWDRKHEWCKHCQRFTPSGADCHILRLRPDPGQPLQPPPLAVCGHPLQPPDAIEQGGSLGGSPWDEDTDEEALQFVTAGTVGTIAADSSETHPWRQNRQSCPQ